MLKQSSEKNSKNINIENYDINVSNIKFILQNSFKDILLSVGNVEIIFFIIDLLISKK